jgi:peptidase E
MTDVVGLQQQTACIGSESPWDHVRQGLSTAGRNDLSAGSVVTSAISQGTADMATLRNSPQLSQLDARQLPAGKDVSKGHCWVHYQAVASEDRED